MQEASDTQILAYALNESRVAVTLDRDFPQILAMVGAVSPPVILIRRERLRASDVSALISAVWQEHERELDGGCIIAVTVKGTRVRKLPLRRSAVLTGEQ